MFYFCLIKNTLTRITINISFSIYHSQVRQFFNEIYPMMVASQSGFDLRFLIAVLCPRAMTRKETQPFAEELGQTNLISLNDLYQAIYDDHQHGDIVYTLSDDALALYDQFDKQICQKLNSQWQNGQLLQSAGATEGGKERRLVLRLAVVLFVVYSYCRRQLFHSHGPVPRVISKPYMKYAIKLMTYFQQQRKEIDKVQIRNSLFKIQFYHIIILVTALNVFPVIRFSNPLIDRSTKWNIDLQYKGLSMYAIHLLCFSLLITYTPH